LILNYKNQILHEYSALEAIKFAYEDKRSTDSDGSVASILGMVSSAHKLDYMRLCADNESSYALLRQHYESLGRDLFKGVRDYQRAKVNNITNEKNYRCVNKFLKNEALSEEQEREARRIISDLDRCFNILESEGQTLQRGQRLYRGIPMSEDELKHFCATASSGQGEYHVFQEFVSTSLSESIAATFAYMNEIRKNDVYGDRTYTSIILYMQNQVNGLPFIFPDANRDVHRNQGQMEVLLPRKLQVKMTHLDYATQHNMPIMYLDIVGYEV
tara:strand:+ start:2815 stop:3630 length:816 start_codon:yes stop_codon:yes gene_type:complete